MIHLDRVSFRNAVEVKLPSSSHIVLLLLLAIQSNISPKTALGRNLLLTSALQNNNHDSKDSVSIKKTILLRLVSISRFFNSDLNWSGIFLGYIRVDLPKKSNRCSHRRRIRLSNQRL